MYIKREHFKTGVYFYSQGQKVYQTTRLSVLNLLVLLSIISTDMNRTNASPLMDAIFLVNNSRFFDAH